MRAFDQLDDHGGAANSLNRWQYIFLVADKGGLGNADMMATEDLQTAKFIPGIRNASGRIRTEHIHLLELANNCRPKISDGCTDTRQNGIVVCQLLGSKEEIGSAFLQVDREF